MTVELRVLGPVEADLGGRVVSLGPVRQRCVLVALLVDAGHVVPVDQLVYRVWGERPPRRTRETLYSYLSRLRKTLATHAVLRRRSGGYLLEADPASIDLHRFRELVTAARGIADDARAAAALEDALGLWRGEAFAGLESAWLDQQRITLDAERHAAELDHVDTMLRLGRHGELLAELETLTAARPLDERLAGQQMLALYRSGRQAAALAAYDTLRETLAGELGIAPSRPLVELRQSMLTGDADPPASGWLVRSQLPLDTVDFTGRAEVIDRVERLLTGGTPLVTIAGLPGVGKTAFAVRLGHRMRSVFPDGQWFVRLHGTRDPRRPVDVLNELLRNCGADGTEDVDAGAAELRSRLAGRRVLMILDDAASTDQVAPLLPGTSGTAVLVTSRQALRGLAVQFAARSETLGVLPPDEAAALLTLILGRSDPELAELCGHLPLALRIAAANAASRTPEEYVRELRAGDRLDLLAVAADPAIAVRVAFDLSYDRLDPEARRLFRLLGLVPGASFTTAVAETLIGTNSRRAVELLLDASLLQRLGNDRYAFHDLLRLYAAEKAAVEDTDAISRLLDHYVNATKSAVDRLYPRAADPPAWLDDEIDNVLAAASLATAHAVRLSALLRRYLRDRGRYTDALTLHTIALEVTGDPASRVGVLTRLGEIHRLLGRHDLAAECSRDAVRLARSTGDRGAEQVALADLGRIRHLQGRFPEAADHLGEAYELACELGDRWAELSALGALGRVFVTWGRHSWAAIYLERELELARLVGHHTAEGTALASLGRVHFLDGRFELAADVTEQALRLARGTGDRFGVLVALTSLGTIRYRQQRLSEASSNFQEVLTIARETGDRNGEFEGLYGLGRVAYASGDLRSALRHLEQAAGLASAIGQSADLARAYDGIADAHHRLGDGDRARYYWEEALTMLDDLGIDKSEDVGAGDIRRKLSPGFSL